MSFRKALVFTLSLAASACDSRGALRTDGAPADAPVPAADSMRPRHDTTPWPLDIDVPKSDAHVNCAPALRWGFVSTAPLPANGTGRVAVTGRVRYWGPTREPLASSPELRREVELVDDTSGQTLLVVQYFLPEGMELPIAEGELYTFAIYSRQMWVSTAQALVIEDPIISSWNVLFVGEPAAYGQALELDDAALSPVTIERVGGPACETTATICGQGAYRDALRFSFTTGAGIEEVTVTPGESDTLSVFGKSYRVTNLWSYHVDFPCDDAPEWLASYLIVASAP